MGIEFFKSTIISNTIRHKVWVLAICSFKCGFCFGFKFFTIEIVWFGFKEMPFKILNLRQKHLNLKQCGIKRGLKCIPLHTCAKRENSTDEVNYRDHRKSVTMCIEYIHVCRVCGSEMQWSITFCDDLDNCNGVYTATIDGGICSSCEYLLRDGNDGGDGHYPEFFNQVRISHIDLFSFVLVFCTNIYS